MPSLPEVVEAVTDRSSSVSKRWYKRIGMGLLGFALGFLALMGKIIYEAGGIW
jgi:hypothetical protein